MQDGMINPDLERFSHAPEVAALIEKAATAAK